jgi:hypothetical protein
VHKIDRTASPSSSTLAPLSIKRLQEARRSKRKSRIFNHVRQDARTLSTRDRNPMHDCSIQLNLRRILRAAKRDNIKVPASGDGGGGGASNAGIFVEVCVNDEGEPRHVGSLRAVASGNLCRNPFACVPIP